MILLLVLFRLIPNISFLLSLCSSPHSGTFGIWSWSHHTSEAQRLRHQSRVHGLGRGRSRGWRRWDILNLYALTSDCIFSILFTIHFQRCWQGEFIEQSRVSLVGDHFLYSHDLNAWFRGDIVRRNNKLLVTLRGLIVKKHLSSLLNQNMLNATGL